MRHPPGRSPGVGLLEHTVDLFEGKPLCLGYEEVSVEEAHQAKGSPYPENLGAEVAVLGVDHVGRDDGDDAVPEPIASGGETDTAAADLQREDFANEDPGAWTPGGGEEEDVDADKGDHGGDAGGVGVVDGADDGDNVLADDHTGGTPDEKRTASEFLDGVKGDGGGAHVDEGSDQGNEERVGDGVEGLEEYGSVASGMLKWSR